MGRDAFHDLGRQARLGVHIQADRGRVADPDPSYVQTALDGPAESCRQLGIPVRLAGDFETHRRYSA